MVDLQTGETVTATEALAAWGAFDRDDPFPLFAEVRALGPVHEVTLADGHRAWLVVRYEEARAALGPTYRRIQMSAVRQDEHMGAVWEYTFTDSKMGPLHGIERGVVVSGHSYLIQFRTPPEKWQQSLFVLDVVTATIRSPGES